MSSFIDEVLEWREKAYREYEGTKIGIEVDYRKIHANGLTEKHRESAKQQLLAEVIDIIGENFVNWGELSTEDQRLEAFGNEIKDQIRKAAKERFK